MANTWVEIGEGAASSGITSLTGGVTASGSGAVAATVVTNANLTGDITSVGNATTLTSTAVANHIKFFDSTASSTGATQTVTVTGLLATDTILSVSPRVTTTATASLNGWAAQANNSLQVTWTADPAVGSIVRVAVLR